MLPSDADGDIKENVHFFINTKPLNDDNALVIFIFIGKEMAGTHNLAWWRHQTEAFSALLALCAGNSPVTSEFPSQRPVTRCFDVFFDLRLNKRLSKQSWG